MAADAMILDTFDSSFRSALATRLPADGRPSALVSLFLGSVEFAAFGHVEENPFSRLVDS